VTQSRAHDPGLKLGDGLGELLCYFLGDPLRKLLAQRAEGKAFMMVSDAMRVATEFLLGVRRWNREQFIAVYASAAALFAGRRVDLLG
jgi:hypothetical protein